VAINISSPNTPGLRKLQLKDHLELLLEFIKTEQHRLFKKHHKYVPVVVKIAPDLSDDELFSFVRIFKDSGLDGIIATNTTLSREGVEASEFAHEPGGLSGEPLRRRAAYMLKQLKSMVDKKTTLIASGGIMNSRDALERMQAGASLVQLYTGLIYSGPGLVRKAAKEIRHWHQMMK
jgi:dihydroorotate dehydrogenase